NFFEKKLSISTRLGIERNNLKGTETNTARRFVGDINTSLTLGERLHLNAAYSNFRNTSKLSTLSQPQLLVDSIVLSQVNQNANFTASYISGEEKNATITATFSYNQANSIQNDQVQNNQLTVNYVASLSHSYVFTASKLTMTSALLANWNQSPSQRLFSPAPTFALRRPFLEDRLNASTSFSYVWVYTDGQFSNSIINWQAGVDYTLWETHNLSMTLALINRQQGELSTGTTNFTEMIWRLNYRWNF
ncbi:MAG: hypothetical protein AAGD05_08330, partial [Bacteroidota bacterium]